MVPNNSLLTERLAVLTTLASIALTAGQTSTSSYVSMRATNANYFQRFMPLINVTSNGTNNIVVSVLKASDTSGTGATAILINTFTNTSGAQTFIGDVNGANVDTSKPFIAVSVTMAGGGTTSTACSGCLIASDGRYDPASTYNIAALTNLGSA